MKEVLKEAGLSETESTAYVSLLQIGEASILDIARHSALKRPTVYNAIESLLRQGLVSRVPNEKRKRFYANPPTTLLLLHKQKEQRLELIIPTLNALVNVPRGTNPICQYYQGESEVLDLYKNIMTTGLEKKLMYTLTSAKNLHRQFPNLVSAFNELSLKNNWKVLELAPMQKNAHDYVATYVAARKDQGHEFKFLPDSLDIFDCDIMVFESTVTFVSLASTVFALTLESVNISNSLATLFKMAWQSAEAA